MQQVSDGMKVIVVHVHQLQKLHLSHVYLVDFLFQSLAPYEPLLVFAQMRFSPEDARVVSFDHGCGAHSEALIKAE